MTNGVYTHGNPHISTRQKESSLVTGEVGTLAFTLPFTRWRAESFIIEAIGFWPDSCNSTDAKKKNLQILAFALYFCEAR